jgi:hypothetical protein
MAETRRGFGERRDRGVSMARSGNAGRAPLLQQRDNGEELIEAAYEFHRRPPDPGGEYIGTVAGEIDAPA